VTERVQKIIAARGLCSRRTAEEWILQGRISCNGVTCALGQTADPEIDQICVDGKPIPAPRDYVYIMLHKPKGYVTTLSDEKGRKNVTMLVADCGVRVFPVGRLDMDSEGLLLMTNDGNFAQMMMHPSHNIDKVYHVTVNNYSPSAVEKLRRPMRLDGYRLSPATVRLLSDEPAVLEMTIHEGRNRQVRRMCAIAGMSVKRLVRVSEGPLKLSDLPVGHWRYLTAEELQQFQKMSD